LLFFFSAPENQSGLLVSARLWLGSRHPNKPDLDQTGLPLSEAIHSDHLPFFPYSRVPASSVFSRPKPVLYIVTNVTAEDLLHERIKPSFSTDMKLPASGLSQAFSHPHV
jgi:hypothetical protein